MFIALGTTDLVFALDSIPAIFGITTNPFIVFAANIFALMGLRQLYFLLGDLIDKLVYLNYGLAVILAFIGVKLVLHALQERAADYQRWRARRRTGSRSGSHGRHHEHPRGDDGGEPAQGATADTEAARSLQDSGRQSQGAVPYLLYLLNR